MPNYPFQPEILDALPEELAELFRALELKLLEEICSRLNIADQLNEVTVQDIRALRAHGIGLEDIKKAIAKTTDTGMDHLEQLLDDVVERNQAYYTELVDLAGVTAPERMVDQEDMWAIYEQTKGTYRNITQSMGFLVRQGRHRVMLPPAKAYQWALDSALLQVQSGAVSYDQAIREAVRELAEGGLKTVSYESEHVDNVDVAVRRATMTGVNQLNQKYREQSMDYLETDLVEVTAHSGARDVDGPNEWENHKKWQGKVYRWKAKPRTSQGRYPDFERVCGYGYVTGIGGANCRHSYWPFIEGVSERTYTDKELENIDPPPIEFEGRRYTAYEATQKQRQIERTIRKQKRLKTAFQEAGLKEDAQAANIRLRRLNEKYRQFSKAAGLPEQRERMRVQYVDDASRKKAVELKVKRDLEAPIRAAIRRGDYPLTINPEKQSRHMVGSALPGRSVITISQEELQKIVNEQAGHGEIGLDKNGGWNSSEKIDSGRVIGYTVNREGVIIETSRAKIHYSKKGVHVVPYSGRR